MKNHLHVCSLLMGLLFSVDPPVLAQWTKAKLSIPRASIAATSTGNKVYFAGGIGASGSTGRPDIIDITSRIDIIDIVSKKSSTASLSQARYALAATSLGSKAFFAGGTTFDEYVGPYSDRVDIYDETTNQWTTASLSQARRNPVAISVGSKHAHWAHP